MAAKQVRLVACGDATENVEVYLSVASEHPAALLVQVGRDEEREFPGVDLFDCLLSLREHLESRGLLLCCQGARRDVSPSGMTRQMSNSRLAYIIRPNARVSDDDLVDIFEPADCRDAVSVAQQKAEIMKIFRHPSGQ